MKGKFYIFFTLLFFLVATGCATTKTVIPDLGKNKTKITLKPGEFRIVKTITGEASCPFLFWIDVPPQFKSSTGINAPILAFDLGDPNLHKLAMKDLHSKHDLKGKPQILHNILEEWSIANYLGLFAILKVTITAEVIEFTGRREGST